MRVLLAASLLVFVAACQCNSPGVTNDGGTGGGGGGASNGGGSGGGSASGGGSGGGVMSQHVVSASCPG